jgi:hypothetical protein
MALITIVIQDRPEGPGISVSAEPVMPRTVLEGPPSPAQAAAAIMLNAIAAFCHDHGEKPDAPRIQLIN